MSFLAFSTILSHSSLFIAILLQFWIFISQIWHHPRPKLSIPILLTAIMIHVGEVFIMRGFGIPPGCSCGLHSSGMLRGTTSEKSEGRKSASLHYFGLREATSFGGFTCSWNEVYSITKIYSLQQITLYVNTHYPIFRLPSTSNSFWPRRRKVPLLTSNLHGFLQCDFFLNYYGNYFTLRYLR